MADRSDGKRGILRGNIGGMILTSGLWNLAGSMTGPFFPLYILELGGNYVDIGIISALRAAMGILPSFLGGYLADAVGWINAIASISMVPIVSSASVIGGALYQGVSMEAPFLASSALQLTGAIYALFAFKEPKKREE
jgi:hypothetical protein